jgi:ribonucleoside-diphosphate reductase alpha chain
MDDLVDLEVEAIDKIISKIQTDPEPDDVKAIELNLWNKIKAAAINGRRTGLGMTAVGDAVAACGLRYGSKESVELAEEMYKALALGSYTSSVLLAKERGSFPVYDANKEKGHPFLEQILDADPELRALHKKYGRRNIALTTTAPTGSVSTLTQTSSGIEPVFMIQYKRRKKINPNDIGVSVDFVDELGDKWQEYVVNHHGVNKWMDATGETDLTKSPYYQATANDIDWEAAVDLQAAAQKWICHAISKTTNLPSTATKEDIHNVYWRGWKSGCKGITVYRDGCRSGVLISNDEASPTDADGRPKQIIPSQAPLRGEVLPCEIHHAQIKGVRWTILVGLLNGQPYELFVGHAENLRIPDKFKVGEIVKIKKGVYDLHVDVGADEPIVFGNISNTFTNSESAWATRIVSAALRHGCPIEFLTEQLSKSGNVSDINKVIARLLKKFIKDGQVVKSNEVCQSCNSSNLVYEEGCLRCLDCGSSKC